MRVVEAPDGLPAALAAASHEAMAAFGDGSVYLERRIDGARHVEVQLLGDADGEVVAVGERDCSVQRRHQKLVEEAPAPGLTVEARRRLHELATYVARAVGLRITLGGARLEGLFLAAGAEKIVCARSQEQLKHPGHPTSEIEAATIGQA